MRCVKKPVLNESEMFENINSKILSTLVPEKAIAARIMKLYGVDVHDMKPEDIGMDWVCQSLIESLTNTDSFEVVSMGYNSEYLESLTSAYSFPNKPMYIEFRFTFKSNQEMNLYKLKNPKTYNELFSERLHLLNKLKL